MIALGTYNKKRNFSESPEPKGTAAKKTEFRFVVQRHDASHLHYDFRLELDGVLKSWAVPKGPSMDPKTKRLAVHVEDHPVSYIHFEGTIPKGNYGAGTVEVWDKGNFVPVDKSGNKITEKQAVAALEKGELKFELIGKKLNGGFVLVQLKKDSGRNWLLIKHRDEPPTTEKSKSKNPAARKNMKRTGSSKDAEQPQISTITKTVTDPVKPMLASSVDKPFDDDEWLYELKLDGYRAVAEAKGKAVKLYSRNGLSFNASYPSLVQALSKLKKPAVLDGEIVLLDNNKPDFQKLQHFDGYRQYPLVYYAFDILELDGKDLKKLPLIERKKILKKYLGKNSVLRYSDHIEKNGKAFFEKVVAENIEGIVAKRKDSFYYAGARSKEWLKIKHHNTQEAVIAGYTSPRGARKHFGALVLGEYKDGSLVYIGHTGTGFTDQALKDLWNAMQPLKTSTSPFEENVKVNMPVTWLKPNLVCEISYSEITRDKIRRHPVFLRLRPDKNASEVTVSEPEAKKASRKTMTKSNSKASSKKSDSESGDKKVTIGTHTLALTNPGKIYWPDEGYTKGDMLNYYETIAPYILPYLKGRPMSLKRNPNGIADNGFFHKDAGEHAPKWVDTANVHSDSSNKTVHYLVCNNKATLLYIANLGCIEMNPWNSTTKALEKPTYFVIDIDPSDKNTFDQVIETAQVVKSVLDKAGAECYCKTSGATGLHVYVPMGNKYDYDHVKEFAHLIAVLTQEQLPRFTSLERSLSKRGPKIYVDYLQNRIGQTLATAYSLRPREGAPVSTPLEWKEVKPGLHPSQFTMENIMKRLESKGDLFAPVLKKGIDLKKCLKRLEGLKG